MHADVVRSRHELCAGIPDDEIQKLEQVYSGLQKLWISYAAKVDIAALRQDEHYAQLDKMIVDALKHAVRLGVKAPLNKLSTIAIAQFDPLLVKNWDESACYIESTVVARLMSSNFMLDMHRFHESGATTLVYKNDDGTDFTVKRTYPFYGMEVQFGITSRAQASKFYREAVAARGLGR